MTDTVPATSKPSSSPNSPASPAPTKELLEFAAKFRESNADLASATRQLEETQLVPDNRGRLVEALVEKIVVGKDDLEITFSASSPLEDMTKTNK